MVTVSVRIGLASVMTYSWLHIVLQYRHAMHAIAMHCYAQSLMISVKSLSGPSQSAFLMVMQHLIAI